MNRRLVGALLIACALLPDIALASAEVQEPLGNADYLTGKQLPTWCGTMEHWANVLAERGEGFNHTCPEGNCDDPAVRDATATNPITVRTITHVIRRANGSGGVSQATVDATIAQMNSDFAGTGVQFNNVATRFHGDNKLDCIATYSQFNSNWYSDIQKTKQKYNENPDTHLNIYISCQDPNQFGQVLLGLATFPWEAEALSTYGGLWLNTLAVGSGGHTATHEMGHCLGLWHTHHGVSEVDACSDCYEFANGFDADWRGDFASDTPPTPTNYNCSPPGGSDCQGTAWGATQPENYMGYGPDSCLDTYTAQQTRRMHCWTQDRLSSLLDQQCTDPAPQAPSGLTATAQGNDQVDLAWSDQSNNEDEFQVERGPAGGSLSVIATVAAGSTTYTDNSVDCETSYDYRVTAVNCGGSASSSIAGATTGTCPAAQLVHIGLIDASISQQGPWTRGQAYVTVHDANHQPVSGATVAADWTGTTGPTGEQVVTGSDGRAFFRSDRERNTSQYCWTITVTDINGANIQYSAADNDVADNASVGNDCGNRPLAARLSGTAPAQTRLLGALPNPFRAETQLTFEVATESQVRLEIYDVQGRLVRTLLDARLAPGIHGRSWDGRNDQGALVHRGIYFTRMVTDQRHEVSKLIVIR